MIGSMVWIMKRSNNNIIKIIAHGKSFMKKREEYFSSVVFGDSELLTFMQIMLERINLNNKNLSQPLSSDPNRKHLIPRAIRQQKSG